MARRKAPCIPDQLPAGADPRTAFDPNGLLDGLAKALAEPGAERRDGPSPGERAWRRP